MKVEFTNSEHIGQRLYVSADEFRKAINNGDERESLAFTLYAFYNALEMEISWGTELFDGILSNLQKTSTVIFAYEEQNRRDKWALVYVRDGNQEKRVFDGVDISWGNYNKSSPTKKMPNRPLDNERRERR